MILEQETFEVYGYYSVNLSAYSHKNVILRCDFCLKQFTKKMSKITSGKSPHCCNSSECMNKKRILKVSEKYGVDNVFQLETVKEKVLYNFDDLEEDETNKKQS